MKTQNITQLIIVLFLLITGNIIHAQDQEIDTSKPTNFYSFLDNTLEYANQPNQNVYGYRGNFTLAPSEAHLVLAEIPLLYNDRTSKFGLGDIRARYFFLPYKNYDKFFGAFGPSIDVFVPTGSFDDGLGSSSWVISPGITIGLMAADWIQFFPIVSYQYVSKPTTDKIPEAQKQDRNGISFQVITPVVFSEKFFIQLTPVYLINDFSDSNQNRFAQELFGAYTLQEKLQLTGFFRGDFEDEKYTFRLGLTVFL